MTNEKLEKAMEIYSEINCIEKYLKEWNRAIGINSIKLYDKDRIFDINVNVIEDIVGFKKLKYKIIEDLETKILQLQKEFDEL